VLSSNNYLPKGIGMTEYPSSCWPMPRKTAANLLRIRLLPFQSRDHDEQWSANK